MKFWKAVAKIAAGVGMVVFWPAGVAIAATSAIVDIAESERRGTKNNQKIDANMANALRERLSELDAAYQARLSEILIAYQQNYASIADRQAHLEQELLEFTAAMQSQKFFINDLPKLFYALHAVASGTLKPTETRKTFEFLKSNRTELDFLMNFSLLHIAILSKDSDSYNLILDELIGTIDFSVTDHNGRSLLSYAELSYDTNLQQALAINQASIAQQQRFKAAHIGFAADGKHVSSSDGKAITELNSILPVCGYTLLSEMMTLTDKNQVNDCVTTCLILGANPLLADKHGTIPFLKAYHDNNVAVFNEMLLHIDPKQLIHIFRGEANINSEIDRLYQASGKKIKKSECSCLALSYIKLHLLKFKGTLQGVEPVSGETALTFAASLGEYKLVALLCNLGVDINQANRFGDTPLIIAARLLKQVSRDTSPAGLNQAKQAQIMLDCLLRYQPKMLHLNNSAEYFLTFKPNDNKLLDQVENSLSAEHYPQWQNFAWKEILAVEKVRTTFNANEIKFASMGNLWRLDKVNNIQASHPLFDDKQAKTPLLLAMYANALAHNLPITTATELSWVLPILGFSSIWSADKKTLLCSVPNRSGVVKITGLNQSGESAKISFADNVVLTKPGILTLGSIFDIPRDLGLSEYYYNTELYFESWKNLFSSISSNTKFISTSSERVTNTDNSVLYIHSMPELDGAFQALGVNRIQATSLVLDKISQGGALAQAICEAIAVQWLGTVLRHAERLDFKQKFLFDFSFGLFSAQLQAIALRYNSLFEDKSLKASELKTQAIAIIQELLFLGKNPEVCKKFAIMQLATPAQQSNILRAIDSDFTFSIPQGGMGLAVSRALGKKLRTWIIKEPDAPAQIQVQSTKTVSQLDAIECKFIDKHPFAALLPACDIMLSAYDGELLDTCSVLHSSAKITLPSILSHINVIAAQKDGVITMAYEPWLRYLNFKSGYVVKGDLLPILIELYNKIEHGDKLGFDEHASMIFINQMNACRQKLAHNFFNLIRQCSNNLIATSAIHKMLDMAQQQHLHSFATDTHSLIERKQKIIEEVLAKVDIKIDNYNTQYTAQLAAVAAAKNNLEDWRTEQNNLKTLAYQQSETQIRQDIQTYGNRAKGDVREERLSGHGIAIFSCVTSLMPPNPDNLVFSMLAAGMNYGVNSLVQGAPIGKALGGSIISGIAAGFIPNPNVTSNYTSYIAGGIAEGLAQGLVAGGTPKDVVRNTCAGAVKGLLSCGALRNLEQESLVMFISNTAIDGLRSVQRGDNREAIFTGMIGNAAQQLAHFHVNQNKNTPKKLSDMLDAPVALGYSAGDEQENAKKTAAAKTKEAEQIDDNPTVLPQSKVTSKPKTNVKTDAQFKPVDARAALRPGNKYIGYIDEKGVWHKGTINKLNLTTGKKTDFNLDALATWKAPEFGAKPHTTLLTLAPLYPAPSFAPVIPKPHYVVVSEQNIVPCLSRDTYNLAPNLISERTGNYTLIDDRQQNSGLTFDDIDLWQDTEFCERKPYHKVNELELLAGTVVGLARASVDLTVASAKFINEFFAEAQRFDDAWNYESVPNQQAMHVWSVNQDYVRNEVRNFIPNVKMAAIAGYHNFAEAMRNIEQDPFNAGYKIGYVGGSVALTGYGTLALARNSVPLILNIEKQTYLIGTKGYAQGRASYTLINALNSSPVVGATATELFASTNTPRQLLFSQIKNQDSRSLSSMCAQGRSPINTEKLTKVQIVEYLQNVDKIPLKYLITDMKKIGNTKRGNGILELHNPELIERVGIYKFKYTNLETGTDKIFIEIHKAKGPNDFHHMHITDRYGNVYDKNLNNLTAKYKKDNPGLLEKQIRNNVKIMPEAHIKIFEFVELNMRPKYE